jgi:hypothetical protein
MFYERSMILSRDISAFAIERVESGELRSRHIERIPSGTEMFLRIAPNVPGQQ